MHASQGYLCCADEAVLWMTRAFGLQMVDLTRWVSRLETTGFEDGLACNVRCYHRSEAFFYHLLK